MSIALAILSVILIVMSLYGAVAPDKLTTLVRGFMTRDGVWFAVAFRVLLALLLWFSAPVSHTPMTFKALALLAFVAAIALPCIGSQRLLRIIDYVASWPPLAIRFQCLLGAAFGGFLLWSASPGVGVS